jgi:hypothetical protein
VRVRKHVQVRFRVFCDVLPYSQVDADQRFNVCTASIIRAISKPRAKG